MDQSRVDEGLQAAMRAPPAPNARFRVQIETKHHLTTAETAILGSYGIDRPGALTRRFSAKLTKLEIDSLSEQPWVQRVSLL